MSMFIEVPISVQPFGYAVAAITDAAHVAVSFDECLINGVKYRASLHLFLWADGAWRLGREEDQQEWSRGRDNSYLSRVGSYDDPTDAARKNLYSKVTTAVILQIIKIDPAQFHQAEIDKRQRDVDRAEEEAGKALQAYEVAQEAYAVALRALQGATNAQN